MLSSERKLDTAMSAQVDFWNRWNATNREERVGAVSMEQAQVVLSWLRLLKHSDLDVIDIGCGTGWLCAQLLEFGKVTGTDLSDQVLERSAARVPSANFVAGDFMRLDFAPGSYDVAVSLEVLPHVADQAGFLHKIADTLRDGGYLMMATQNRRALEKNDIRPPAAGQLRRWVDHEELSRLLGDRFEVIEMFSITPQFNSGWLRYLNSQRLHLLLGKLGLGAANRLLRNLQERAWLGWSLMVLARKRAEAEALSPPPPCSRPRSELVSWRRNRLASRIDDCRDTMVPRKSLVRRLGSRVLKAIRRATGTSVQLYDDVTRWVAMVGILRPAANHLPLRWALALSKGFGFLGVTLSGRGRRALRLMRQAFGDGTNDRQIRRMARDWLSRPGRDSVLARSALRGRLDPTRYRIEEKNADLVEPLRQSGTPFIVATGHFAREAFALLASRNIMPAKVLVVANPPIVENWHPRSRWLGYHYGQLLKYLQWARPDWTFGYPGTANLLKTLVQHLRAPGNAVLILADAPWQAARRDSYVRPFAGRNARAFATGVVHMSRLAQCPIAVCLPYVVAKEHVVIEWTRVIPPPPPRGNVADAQVLDPILDDIETAIGKRPSQYVLDFLSTRRWNAGTERWQCKDSPAQ